MELLHVRQEPVERRVQERVRDRKVGLPDADERHEQSAQALREHERMGARRTEGDHVGSDWRIDGVVRGPGSSRRGSTLTPIVEFTARLKERRGSGIRDANHRPAEIHGELG